MIMQRAIDLRSLGPRRPVAWQIHVERLKMEFYSTAAQVIPTLLIVAALQSEPLLGRQ